jgi:hypothetical protein
MISALSQGTRDRRSSETRCKSARYLTGRTALMSGVRDGYSERQRTPLRQRTAYARPANREGE